MNIKAFYFLIFLIIPLWGFSQSKPEQLFLGTGPSVPKQSNAVIRDFSTHILIQSENKILMNVKMAITILDNEGKYKGVIKWFYDGFSNIKSGNVWVYDTLGHILEKKRLSQLEDVGMSGLVSFFDELRMKYYNPLIKKTPYTVQFEYTKLITGFFQLPVWSPQPASNTYVVKANLIIENESNLKYRYYSQSFPDSSLMFSDKGKIKTWRVTNLPPIDIEGYTYQISNQLPHIRIQLESFNMDGFPGEFHDWKSFGQWSYDLNKGRQILPQETALFIKELTDTIPLEKDKARSIYNWMQDQTRYISIQLGIGGWQSFSAADVDKKKYGDCKALSNYTMALMNAADIEAYYSLVSAGSNKKPINPSELSNRFNHVILCLPLQGDTTWLECTSDDTPFGFIGSFTDDRYALLIKDGGSKLVKTSYYHLEDNILQRKSNIQINKEGGIKGSINAVYHNLFVQKRQFQMNEALPDRKDNIYDIVGINGFHIDHLSYSFHKDIHPSITENIDFTVRKIATTTSSRMFFPLFYLNKKTRKIKRDTERKNDIIIQRAYTNIDTIIYHLPSGFQVQSLPKEISLNSDFGTYQSSISQNENIIIYIRKEQKYKGVFSKERYDEFRKYKNSIIKADKTSLVLEKTE